MRVSLTKADLESQYGKHLLELCTCIAADGKLELEEIKALRRWLRENHAESNLGAAKSLHHVMRRITADGVIDRDELLDLFLAVERVIPVAQRTAVAEARRNRIARQRAADQAAKWAPREELRREESRRRQAEYRREMRLRHLFTKIAGVTFQNDDGSERQQIIFLFTSDVTSQAREQYVTATIGSEIGCQSSIDYVNSVLSDRAQETRPWWKIW